MASVEDILLMQGRSRANAMRERSAIKAQGWTNLADIIGGTVNQLGQERQQRQSAQREQAIAQTLKEILSRDQEPDPNELMALVGPERTAKIMDALKAGAELHRGVTDDARTTAGRFAAGVNALPRPLQEEWWPGIRAAAVKGGLPDLPEQFSPESLQMVSQWASGAPKDKPLITGVAAGGGPERQVDAPGVVPYQEPKPQPAPKQFEVVVKGPNGRPIKKLVDEATMQAGVEQYERPAATPQSAPTYEWVLRDGKPANIQRGTAKAGDVPYTQPRAGAQFDPEMDPDLLNAASRASMSVTPAKREAFTNLANRLWREGDTDQLKEIVRQASVENESEASKAMIRGRQTTIAALDDAKGMLEELKAAGVPTGWLSGTFEDLARRVGESTDPKLATFKTRLMDALINYRRAATGAAFGVKEGADYERLFPNYKQSLPVNLAVIEGLTRAMKGNDQVFWENKLGKGGAALVGATGGGGQVEEWTRDASGKLVKKGAK